MGLRYGLGRYVRTKEYSQGNGRGLGAPETLETRDEKNNLGA